MVSASAVPSSRQCTPLSMVNSGMKLRIAFSLPVPTEMAILKGVFHMTDTPTSRG